MRIAGRKKGPKGPLAVVLGSVLTTHRDGLRARTGRVRAVYVFPETTLTPTCANLNTTNLRGAEIEGLVVQGENLRGALVTPTQAMDPARLLGLVIG